jgi:hypothetical protein
MHSKAEFLFWEKNCPFMTNNRNLSKRVKIQNNACTIHRNTTNSFIPLGSNIQFQTIFNKHRKRTIKNNFKKLVTMNK